MPRLFGVIAGGALTLAALPAQSASAAQISVEPTSARPGEVWTVSGVPDEPEVAWSLLGDDGSFHIIGVTHDPQSIEQVVVPDVEAGRYELVATWGPQEFRRSARQGVVVLSLVPAGTPVDATERDQPIAGGSRPASTAAPSRQARGPRSDESLGFRVVADPRVSLAIDAALLSLAAVVLWRSRWIRAVVVESVRHPRTPVTIERHGSDVVVRRAPGP